MPGDEWLLEAFWDLSTTRQLGFGAVGPVPWHMIDRYADRAGLDSAGRRLFNEAMRALDAAYRKWIDAEAAKGENGDGAE